MTTTTAILIAMITVVILVRPAQSVDTKTMMNAPEGQDAFRHDFEEEEEEQVRMSSRGEKGRDYDSRGGINMSAYQAALARCLMASSSVSASMGVHPQDFCALLIERRDQARGAHETRHEPPETMAPSSKKMRDRGQHKAPPKSAEQTRPSETTILSGCILMSACILGLFFMLFVPEAVSMCASALAHDE